MVASLRVGSYRTPSTPTTCQRKMTQVHRAYTQLTHHPVELRENCLAVLAEHTYPPRNRRAHSQQSHSRRAVPGAAAPPSPASAPLSGSLVPAHRPSSASIRDPRAGRRRRPRAHGRSSRRARGVPRDAAAPLTHPCVACPCNGVRARGGTRRACQGAESARRAAGGHNTH